MDIDVDESVVQAWDALFNVITSSVEWTIELSDSSSNEYDFSNHNLMHVMRERLLGALLVWYTLLPDRDDSDSYIYFGNEFFSTMSRDVQRSFFHTVLNLPLAGIGYGEAGPENLEIHIDTPALLDALELVSEDQEIPSLSSMSNFSLANITEVHQLRDIIHMNNGALEQLHLESVECPLIYERRDRRDRPIGFLDPLCHALLEAQYLEDFSFLARTLPISPLMSPDALLLILQRCHQSVSLNRLGLNDSHCLAIAQHISEHGTVVPFRFCVHLNLEMNPGITDDGYQALFDAANCTYGCPTFSLDNKHWESRINLVHRMNFEYDRLDYFQDGYFISKEHWVEWLESLTQLDEDAFEDEAERLSCLYYTIHEEPEFLMP